MINIRDLAPTILPLNYDWLNAFYQAQINIFDTSGGGIIYFPAGIYYFSHTLQVFCNCIIKGEGPHSSQLIISPNKFYDPISGGNNLPIPPDGIIAHGTNGGGRTWLPLGSSFTKIAPHCRRPSMIP